MKHRHKAKKSGGGVDEPASKPEDGGGNPDVMKEAKAKTVGMLPGGIGKKRLDRARGGRVGADKSPMSANSSKNPITSAGKC